MFGLKSGKRNLIGLNLNLEGAESSCFISSISIDHTQVKVDLYKKSQVVSTWSSIRSTSQAVQFFLSFQGVTKLRFRNGELSDLRKCVIETELTPGSC